MKNFFRFSTQKQTQNLTAQYFWSLCLLTRPFSWSVNGKDFFIIIIISLFLFLCVRSQYICQAFGCCSFVGKKHAIAYIVLNLLCHAVFVLSFAFKTLWRICRTLILILFLKKKIRTRVNFELL